MARRSVNPNNGRLSRLKPLPKHVRERWQAGKAFIVGAARETNTARRSMWW